MTTPEPLGFRPATRSRTRIALGVILVLAAVAAVLLVFDGVDRRAAVLQVVRDIPAGTQVSAADVRVVEVGGDPTLALVPAGELDLVVGSYTKVRIVSGGLLAHPMLQSGPLVAPGSSVVAVSVAPGELPAGLRERSQVLVVMPPVGADVLAPEPVTARVVGLPTEPDQITGSVSVSVEVAAADAVTIASSTAVRLVLLDPGIDGAATVEAGA
jgi:hypothetical protein